MEKGNTNLIDAAPELLEALQNIVKLASTEYIMSIERESFLKEWDEWVTKSKSLINKILVK